MADHQNRLVQDRSALSKALEDDLAKLAESRSSIDGLVAGQVEKLAEGRDILTRALEADLNTIRSAIADQSQKLSENRGEFARVLEADLENVNSLRRAVTATSSSGIASTLSKALEDDLAKLAESRSSIDGLVAGQVEKLAEGRDILKRALEADLQKLSASRGEVDDIIAGHVGKLAEGRDMLTQALEDDLGKLADTRKDVDRSLSGHIDQIAARSTDISAAIAADVEKIEQAFSRQTGIIEERAGTMERALSTGVDNVRSVLEKSAVFVAGALREKVHGSHQRAARAGRRGLQRRRPQDRRARRADLGRPAGPGRGHRPHLRGRGSPPARPCRGHIDA